MYQFGLNQDSSISEFISSFS